ncbi:putative assembly protein [Roseovarius gaetbuli]|uniref:Putative assembly protein n=1 Tax=Roseovarius gaetbuli TaxID=1356575 RepID=A0A1X6YNP0_9RHOB|nr:AsmA family protein [Roseovarius gaetbuli]SLN26829.1 putative assembly protein [Roseovarius gaetbuli]
MRWVFRLIGLLIVIVVVIVGSLFLLPGDRIARIAADQITSATGRKVTMQGDTKISFYPVLGVSTGVVEVANAEWSDAGPMLRADSLKIGVEPNALFGGDIRITGLEMVNPEIQLERAANGRVNWELGVEGVAPSGQSGGSSGAPAQSKRLALTLDRALITGASLKYTDHGTGEVQDFRNMDFELRWPSYDGTATFEATLRPAGEAVRISGQLEQVGQFIDGAVTGVAAKLTSPGGSLGFAGRAGLQPQLEGRLDVDIASTPGFMAGLGLGAVDVPKGFGRSIKGSSQITLTDDMRLSLRDLALALGGNQIAGGADIMLGETVPRINAQLNAGALDLSSLAGADSNGGGGGSGSGGGGGDSGWSKAAIDASALALANGEVALVADSVNLGDLKLGKTRTLMTLDRSRAVFGLRELRAYDGLITGEFVVNNRSGLSVGGNMNVSGINLETFLADAIDVSRFSARGDSTLSFLGSGRSVHAIMNSLSGKGSVKTGRGVISGFDLDRLMRSGDMTGGTTVFDEMSASFTMDKGNLFNSDLLMNLPLAKATGKGRVGLGARDIDYLFTPVLLEGENSRGLAIPVRIRGPWANPRITPDLEKALDLNLKEERKKLETKAKEELNRAVEKKLRVTPEEGQSVEDAVKDKLEERAKRELRKLFK